MCYHHTVRHCGQLTDSGGANGPSQLHHHLVTLRHTQVCVVCSQQVGRQGFPQKEKDQCGLQHRYSYGPH